MQSSVRTVSTLFLTLVMAAGAAGAEVRPAESSASRERETMERLRAIAGALLSRQVDEVSAENRLNVPSEGWVLASQASELVRMPAKRERRSYGEVYELLRPREDFIYLCDIPDRDAWGSRIEVYYEQENLLRPGSVVTVRSAGANRRIDADVYEVGGFLPGAATDDIVISDRRFVRWPLGMPEVDLRVEPRVGACPGAEEEPAGRE